MVIQQTDRIDYTHNLEDCGIKLFVPHSVRLRTLYTTIWKNVGRIHAQSNRMSIIGEGIG